MTFFDNAWEYHDGRSELLLGDALRGRRDEVFLMTKVCTHGRDARVGLEQLDESLRRLRTDHLDLWQIHECIYDNDPDLHFAPGGVVEALDEAKRKGKVRFVGFTGHKHPDIHLRMLEHGYPFDAVQMPLNCFDASFRSFERRVLPELVKRGIAALGMKSMGGGGNAILAGVVTRGRGAALRDEPAGRDGGQRRRRARRAPAEPRRRARVRADDARARWTRCAPASRASPATGATSSTRRRCTSTRKVGREQHGIPPRSELPL